MKKLMAGLAAVGLLAAVALAADYTPVSVESTSATLAASRITGTAVTQATASQADTNVTTTVTGYTPTFRGQVLIGGAGTGTNGVWIAKGTTTNDWVQVEP